MHIGFRVTGLVLITLFLNAFRGTGSYPTDYFQAPIEGKLLLSGTFGELRPNHFHSGIDLKPNQGYKGQDVLAAAEGYVHRVKVRSRGYGRAVYLMHPNGYSTVYAHLDAFHPKLEAYVRDQQYRNQSFEVDLYPEPGQFTFEKGTSIGQLGNSGSSSGPHLHFEIRKSDRPINPLLFGFPVHDGKAPKLHQLKVYHLDREGHTLGSQKVNLIRSGDHYRVPGDTLLVEAWRVGLGLKAYDHMEGTTNWNGIFSLDLYANDSLAYRFELEKFGFSETRYLNAHLDYQEQVSRKSYFHRCYRLPGNRLSIYGHDANEGVFPIYSGKTIPVKMLVSDPLGNTSALQCWIKRAETVPAEPKAPFNYFLPYGEQNTIVSDRLEVRFPKGSFYHDCYFRFGSTLEHSAGYFSPVYQLHEQTEPVHRYFDISIHPFDIPEQLRSKAFIAYCDKKENKTYSCGGAWSGSSLVAPSRLLGDYVVMVDDEAPEIKVRNFRENMRGESEMSFRIRDQLETIGKARDLRYRATVDGEWILMEYDQKNDLLVHTFDGRIPEGEHLLRLEVTDDRGNVGVLERKFLR